MSNPDHPRCGPKIKEAWNGPWRRERGLAATGRLQRVSRTLSPKIFQRFPLAGIDLKEMPGCMLWQEKLSSPLPLAPKETMVWAVPGFLRHTVRPPTQPPFPSGETVSSAFSPHSSSTEAVYPTPNPEGVRGDHLESVALLQNCMRNGPSEEGPDEPTVWVQVLPFGLPTS